MVARFLGGAGGSLLGAAAWGRYGWPGVCTVCIALLAIGIVIHFVGPRPAKIIGPMMPDAEYAGRAIARAPKQPLPKALPIQTDSKRVRRPPVCERVRITCPTFLILRAWFITPV